MHCRPTNICPPIVYPTKCCVNHTFSNNVVPHIHPSHTTTVNHINYQHQHSFPHTQSVVNEVTSQNVVVPPGPVPFAGPGVAGGPGFGAGPGVAGGPGFGAGPGMAGPGFGAGPMAGPGFGGAPFGR